MAQMGRQPKITHPDLLSAVKGIKEPALNHSLHHTSIIEVINNL